MKRYPTKYVSIAEAKRLGLDGRFPVAGPYPSITGMKNLYWGKDALVIRSGIYIYNVDQETYDKA